MILIAICSDHVITVWDQCWWSAAVAALVPPAPFPFSLHTVHPTRRWVAHTFILEIEKYSVGKSIIPFSFWHERDLFWYCVVISFLCGYSLDLVLRPAFDAVLYVQPCSVCVCVSVWQRLTMSECVLVILYLNGLMSVVCSLAMGWAFPSLSSLSRPSQHATNKYELVL